ncbi:MAG: Npt1/Npt2 family nucleotide transporter [Candidatus Krumholzibacteriota bacterium]
MNWLSGLLPDLRPGERRIAVLMAANYFLLLLFHYLLKPARDSLFLVEISPSHLPLVYILTALIAAPVTAAYARAGLRRRLDRLIALTIVILMANLVVLRLLIGVRQEWVFYLFYSWVGVAGGLTTSQFWLLANGVFDAAQAKRLFPFLGLGGIAGAFAGGEITSILISNWGLRTQDLLVVSVFVLAAAGFMSRLVWRSNRTSLETPSVPLDEKDRGGDLRGIIRSIAGSRHLSLTVGIIALTVMTGSFIDFQFKNVSWQVFNSEAELTSFLGRFYGRMSLLSLLVQALFATRLIRWLGVGGVLLVLPAVLAGGALGMFLMPGLVAAMFMRGGDITLKYSVDKTSRELLFLPIPLALKKRTKVFIDMFVDRWARGMAGGFLLLMTMVLEWDLSRIALVTLVLLAAWLVLAFLMRREYVNSFRLALARREIDLAGLTVRIDDGSTVKILVGALKSENLREVIYALDTLQGVESPLLAEGVRPLVDHPSAEVRRRSLEVLCLNGDFSDGLRAREYLTDRDLGVRVAAVACVANHDLQQDRSGRFLGELLAGAAAGRNAALAFIAGGNGGEDYRDLVTEPVVDAILNDTTESGVEGREILAGLSWDPADCSADLWEALIRDQDAAVVKAVIAGLGAREDFSRLEWLLVKLDHPLLRVHARGALAKLARADVGVIEELEAFFLSPDHSVRAREEIPRILEMVPEQECVDTLVRHLGTHRPEFRLLVLKALGKLRSRYRSLDFDQEIVSNEITIEARRFFLLSRLGDLLPDKGDKARLLEKAVAETRNLRLESVFRLLGLLYPLRDVLNSYHGVISGRRVPRANAQEFLDNMLAGRHRGLVLALLDEQSAAEAWRETGLMTEEDFAGVAGNTAEALDFLSRDCDPWLAACAIFAGGRVENPAADHHLKKSGDDMLSPIEKVLLLQNVEVFAEVPTDQLAALAAIAREVPVLAGDTVFRENDSPDALYLVLEGHVRLHQGEREVTTADRLMSFGTWALFDDDPRVLTATATEDTKLLRIDRNEFNDLLSDDVRIAKGIIRTVTRKLRELAGRAS